MSDWRLKKYRERYYAVRSVNGKTERTALRTGDILEAKRYLADHISKPTGDTVGAIVEAYLADKDKTAIRAKDLRGSWKQAEPTFGHLRPDQVTRDVCRAYRDARYKQGRMPATVRKDLEVVRAALNFFKKGGQSVFELPPQPKAKDRFLSKGEARALIKAARKVPHIRAFIVLSLTTAARQSALLELTWDRVDFRLGRISLALGDDMDESGKRRANVPMNRRARMYLEALHRARTSDYVIEYAGRRVLSVKKGFRAAVDRAELEGVTPHILRHTAASWMAMARVEMLDISKYLGHSDMSVTIKRYAKVHPDFLKKASEALDW
jgi:integrase